MHLSYAEINLSKLKQNVINIRKKINKVKFMAVVKADAYGHGMKEVAKILNSLGKYKPEYFAVAFPDEGVNLRNAKIKQPILVFEPFVRDQVKDLFKYDLTATVFNKSHLEFLKDGFNKFADNKSSKIKVHVKVDTGMNRLGIDYDKAFDFISDLSNDKNFIIKGIYTHFATSDEKDKSFAKLQLRRFKILLKNLRTAGIKTGLVHASNSGAVLDLPEANFDMIRPGLLMYGYYPSLETSESIKIEPVMEIISVVSTKKKIRPGESVGYGRKFIAKKETNIISVPIGYADGFYRGLSNKARAVINGKFYNQIGTVAMDRIMFDVKNENVSVGDKVTIIGSQGNSSVSAWDWAKILNTIPYEITCGFRKRIQRKYLY